MLGELGNVVDEVAFLGLQHVVGLFHLREAVLVLLNLGFQLVDQVLVFCLYQLYC